MLVMNNIVQKLKANAAALIILIMVVPASVFAQNKVTGTVSDHNNSPLGGVNVFVPGTSIGTSTGGNGKFSVSIPEDAKQVLVFSMLGFKSDTVQIGARSVIDVKLTESSNVLDEVVMVGYGTMRRSDITGSISSVKINDTEAAGTTSFDRLIQGRAAGVQVTSGSAAPGGAVEIKIRGTSSFNSSSEPLYVVDGIIMAGASQDTPSIGSNVNYTAQQNPLATLNPSDIQDIQILKDASATAIYGAQGANGVVLITTKGGTSAKPRIDYSSTAQWSQPTKKIPILNKYSYATWRNEIGQNRINPDTTVGMDWQDYSMRTAFSNTQRVSVSGKTDQTNYMVSGSFANNNGIIKQTGLKVGTLRINLDNTIGKYVKVGTRSNFSYISNNMTQGTEPSGTWQTSMIRQMLNYQPYLQNGTDFSSDNEDLSVEGPQAWFRDYEDRSRDFRITPSVYAEVNIIKGLTFRSTFGSDYRRKIRMGSYGLGLYTGSMNGGVASVSTLQSFKYNLDNIFNFNYQLGKYHNISGMAGMSIAYSYAQNAAVASQGFVPGSTINWGSDGILLGTAAMNTTSGESFGQPKSSLMSYLARVVYNFKERYVLTATFRADGTSKFSIGNKYDYFPSFAFAWRASEEPFLKQYRFIDNLKLRVGWGRVGNQSSVTPYQTLSTYGPKPYALPTGGYETGYAVSGFANPLLRWEVAQQWNTGMDLNLFKNRLNATLDLYLKDTKRLLQQIPMPTSSGFSTMWVNRGTIRNRGIELSLDGIPVQTKDFSISLGGNISFNRNKITDTGLLEGQFGSITGRGFLGPAVTYSTYMKTPGNIFLEGQPAPMFYGYKTDGIIQANEVGPYVANVATGTAGHIRFIDQNGDGQITDADLTIIGNPNPKFTGGFFLNVTYKNLSLDVNFNAVYGNDVLNGNRIIENNVANSNNKNIRSDPYFLAWRPDAPSNAYPGLNDIPDNSFILDRYIEDGSFLRMSNASLSYHFKLKHLVWVKGITVSLSGNNLLLFTNYSGWDPEVNSFSYDPLRTGIDWGSYPTSRSYIVGVALTF